MSQTAAKEPTILISTAIPADKAYIVPWSSRRAGESWEDYCERAAKEAVTVNNVQR